MEKQKEREMFGNEREERRKREEKCRKGRGSVEKEKKTPAIARVRRRIRVGRMVFMRGLPKGYNPPQRQERERRESPLLPLR